MKGLILKNIYSIYTVIDQTGKEYEVSLRGKAKAKEKFVVGDYCEFDENTLTIESLYPRKNMLIRPRVANLDYLCIVSSLVEPTFSYDLIFKYITYSNAYGIKPIVVITKTDLSKEEILEIKRVFDSYKIPYFFTNKKDPNSALELKEFLKGKTSAFMGQSGVGKSTLLNVLDPSMNRKEGSYSKALGRGKHETKEVILFPFNEGFIADTPGFSSLELKLNKAEIAGFFPRFAEFLEKCEYNDCLHLHEKDCEIKRLVEANVLDPIGYKSYLKLLDEVINPRR